MIKLPFSQQEHFQIFSTSLANRTYALPFDFSLERDPKTIFHCQCEIKNYTDQVLDFLLYDTHEYIHTQNLPVYNSGQYTCVTGLCNFFFVLQDLIDKINSYFQRRVFQRNLFLIDFWHSTSQVFSDANKQPSLEWHYGYL